MVLTHKEKESLRIISENSNGQTIPAIKLDRNDPKKLFYAFLLNSTLQLKKPTKQKEKKWNKATLPTP